MPRVGQWNMMNKVITLHQTAVLVPQPWPKLLLHQVPLLSQALLFIFISLSRKWSMVVESGAGCASTSREMCKTVSPPDSVVNSLACARPQEWQVSMKCFLHIVYVIFLLFADNNSVTINYRTLLWSLFFRQYTCVRIRWSEV